MLFSSAFRANFRTTGQCSICSPTSFCGMPNRDNSSNLPRRQIFIFYQFRVGKSAIFSSVRQRARPIKPQKTHTEKPFIAEAGDHR